MLPAVINLRSDDRGYYIVHMSEISIVPGRMAYGASALSGYDDVSRFEGPGRVMNT